MVIIRLFLLFCPYDIVNIRLSLFPRAPIFIFLGGFVDKSVEDYESWDTSSTKASRRAFKFDATNPDQGFVAAPSMLHGRAGCRALAFKGKIYVFSGPALRRELFGEFFDPESQKWTKIDPPLAVVVGSGSDLLQLTFGGQSAFPYDKKDLLVASKDDRYWYWLYNVKSNSWTVCPFFIAILSFFLLFCLVSRCLQKW